MCINCHHNDAAFMLKFKLLAPDSKSVTDKLSVDKVKSNRSRKRRKNQCDRLVVRLMLPFRFPVLKRILHWMWTTAQVNFENFPEFSNKFKYWVILRS